MEFSEDIENAICLWFERALNQKVSSIQELQTGTLIASTLIYFDSEFRHSLSDIFKDFQNCRDNQRYHFSLSNWKIIIAALD